MKFSHIPNVVYIYILNIYIKERENIKKVENSLLVEQLECNQGGDFKKFYEFCESRSEIKIFKILP